jgi:hypothetical protein
MQSKYIKITDYSQEFIKKAIASYINHAELNRKRVAKYYATKHGKEANQMRAKIYYYKVKKKNAYHPEYNPEGIKNETQTITNTT